LEFFRTEVLAMVREERKALEHGDVRASLLEWKYSRETVAKAIMNRAVETTAEDGPHWLHGSGGGPKDEYLTHFQYRQAARQKTLANWLRLTAMSHRFQ
jgi:hypothetical protein